MDNAPSPSRERPSFSSFWKRTKNAATAATRQVTFVPNGMYCTSGSGFWQCFYETILDLDGKLAASFTMRFSSNHTLFWG